MPSLLAIVIVFFIIASLYMLIENNREKILNAVLAVTEFILQILSYTLLMLGMLYLAVLAVKIISFIFPGIIDLIVRFQKPVFIVLAAIYLLGLIYSLTSMGESRIKRKISNDISHLSIRNDYYALVSQFNEKYKAAYLKKSGSTPEKFDELIREMLKKFCDKNKETLKSQIVQKMRERGIVEMNEFEQECADEYGDYCIGPEKITHLIRTYIKSTGEKAINCDDGSVLIKYPGATSGTALQQRVINLD